MGVTQVPEPPRIEPKQLSSQEYRNRQVLLDKVHHFWVKGVLERSLHNQVPIELGLTERPDAVAHPWHLVDATQTPLPPGTKAIDLFDAIGKGRTLLILGEPGSGKTITLLELARDLIDRAQQDIDRLIPVVFNLSSWGRKPQGKSQIKLQNIADWLVEELHTKYQVPIKIGQAWVQQQQLLCLLDGLDEMRAEYREACVDALNLFHQEYNPEIIVCSRIQDYESLSNRLNFQQSIYLQPLNLAQIDRYLDRVGADFAGLKILLADDREIQELATSPLTLSIMALAYEGVAVEALPKTERRQQLFDAYIDRMFARRVENLRYSKQQVKRWLIWLAQRMQEESQTIFSIDRLQISWLHSNKPKQLYRIAIEILLGLGYGMAVGFHYGLLYGAVEGTLFGFINGLIVCVLFLTSKKTGQEARQKLLEVLIFGMPVGMTVGIKQGINNGIQEGIFSGFYFALFYVLVGMIATPIIRKEIEPVETLQFSISTKNYSILGLFAGTILGFGFGRFFGISQGWTVGIICSITWVILGGFEKGSSIDKKIASNQGIWISAANAVTFTAIGGSIGGLVYWLVGGFKYGLVGFFSGGLIATIGGGGSGIVCIKHFVLRCTLWLHDCIPWNYARFLDRAVDLIFLQKVGGGYIFIHRLLLEHFAQMPLENSTRRFNRL